MQTEAEFNKELIESQDYLKRFAISLTRDGVRADDLVQETVLRAIKNRESFRPGTNLQAWLTTIMRNHFFSQYRKKKETEDPEGLGEKTYSRDGDIDQTADKDELSEVLSFINTLPPAQQDVLKYIAEGLSYEEIAATLNIEVGTVKSRVNRAREMLSIIRPGTVLMKDNVVIKTNDKRPQQRPIVVTGFSPIKPLTDPGDEPVLLWLAIDILYVDERYQRQVTSKGMVNIRHIAENFQWNKFTPVIVAFDGERYLIVDGQHRTYGACLRGILRVPCMVTFGDVAKQADAFAAINGKVTQINELQVFHSLIQSGDKEAIEISKICQEAGVKICRSQKVQGSLRAGETLALASIRSVYKKFGPACLSMTMKCIMQRHRMDAGVLRGHVITAMAETINTLDEMRPPYMYQRASEIDLRKVFIDSQKQKSEGTNSLAYHMKKNLYELFRLHTEV